MFSIITIASSTTNPVAMVSAISVRLFHAEPARYMRPKVPTSESGTAMARDERAAAVRRKRKITITTGHREHQFELHVLDRGAGWFGAVGERATSTDAGSER